MTQPTAAKKKGESLMGSLSPGYPLMARPDGPPTTAGREKLNAKITTRGMVERRGGASNKSPDTNVKSMAEGLKKKKRQGFWESEGNLNVGIGQ